MLVNGSKVSGFLWRLIDNLPLLAPVVLAVFGSVITLCLISFGLKNIIVWPLGLILSAIPVVLIWKYNREKLSGKELSLRRKINLLVLIGVVVWVIFNMFFVAHDVFITRDPGIYTNTGQWLVNNETTDIKTPPIIEGKNNLINYSGGIWLTTTSDKTVLQPQGMHLLTGYLGLAGRIFGPNGIFMANVIFGGVALLALYGFSRMIMKPGWAALATIIVASTLPFLYFSRHTYTEIIALALTFGALSTLWFAQSKTRKPRQLWPWVLAGFMVGAGTLARPDAYLSVAAVAVYLVVATALAASNERGLWIKRMIAYIVASTVPMVLAILDLLILTDSYYTNVHVGIKIQLALLVMALVGGAILIALSWKTKLLEFLDRHTNDWRVLVAAIVVVSGFLILMLRPILFYSIHHTGNNSGDLYGFSVRNQTDMNTSPKLVIDHTIDWNAFYIGMPLVLLGIAGLAIIAAKTMRDRQVKYLPLAMIVGLTVLMYGILPQITLDQIWAIRRFLPVILPGLVVLGIYALDRIYTEINIEAKLKKTLIVFSAVFAVLIPATISRPYWFVAEGKNNYHYLTELCNIFPQKAQVIWLGSSLELDAVHSTRTYCGNYSLGYNFAFNKNFKKDGRLDKAELRRIANINNAADLQTVFVIRTHRATKLAPEDRKLFNKVLDYRSQQLETTYYSAPQEIIDVNDGFEMATFDQGGKLVKYPNLQF